MTGGRALKLAGFGVLATVAAIPLAIAIVVGAIFLLLWATRDSQAAHARKEVQSLLQAGTVKSCARIGSDEEARIYRCRIVAKGCVRTHRFVVFRDWGYGVAPYADASYTGEHPCRHPSD